MADVNQKHIETRLQTMRIERAEVIENIEALNGEIQALNDQIQARQSRVQVLNNQSLELRAGIHSLKQLLEG